MTTDILSHFLYLVFLHHARLLRGREGYGGGSFGGLMRKTEHIVPISQMEWPLGTAPFPFPLPFCNLSVSLFTLSFLGRRLSPTSPSLHCILLAQ